MGNTEKPWYKKKRYIISLVVLALIIVFGLSDGANNQIKPESATIPSYEYNSPAYQPASSVNGLDVLLQKPEATSNNTDSLSNDNYYTNVNGNKVHSPAYSSSVPSGASARCGDGTYSFSQNRRGTCSHHGGVAEWL